MNYIFFDTETTGLFDNAFPPECDRQPHCVQIACQLTDDKGTVLNQYSSIVNAGTQVPKGASDVHGITTEMCKGFGVKSANAFFTFMSQLRLADTIVAHNTPFDLNIMSTWAWRIGFTEFQELIDQRKVEDTLQMAKPIMQLPPTERMLAAGYTGFKNPNLGEAYSYFTGNELSGAHDALVDVNACREIFFIMKEQAT